jgi:MFS family permease
MNESPKLWTRKFTAIVSMAFLFFLCLQLLTAGFPAFITDIKDNPTKGGLMTTVFMVAAIVTRPFIGFLMNRVNIKVISIFSFAFIVVTVGLSYGQDSVPFLLLLRVFHGIGFGIMSTILATMATSIIPKKKLGEGIGYYGLATSVGTSMGPMLGVAVLQYFSFNLLLILSVLLAIITLIFSFFINSPPKPVSNKPEKEKGTFKKYAFDKTAFVPCILTSFFTITLGGVISFLKELGKEANIEGSISLFFLVMAIVMIVARPISGRLFDSWGHKLIIYPATVCGIIGLFLLSITHNTFTLLLAGLFYGIAYGTVTPTLQAIAVSVVTKDKQGTANAMYFSSMDLGMAIGSTGLGILASYTGYHFIYGFSILCLVGLLLTYTILYGKRKRLDSVPVTTQNM